MRVDKSRQDNTGLGLKATATLVKTLHCIGLRAVQKGYKMGTIRTERLGTIRVDRTGRAWRLQPLLSRQIMSATNLGKAASNQLFPFWTSWFSMNRSRFQAFLLFAWKYLEWMFLPLFRLFQQNEFSKRSLFLNTKLKKNQS